MSCVLLNAFSKVTSDCAFRGFCCISRTHEVAPRLNGISLLEGKYDTRATSHEVDQIIEEWTFPVNGIEAFGKRACQPDKLERSNIEAFFENPLNYVSGLPGSHCIGFDDCKRSSKRFVSHM